VLQNMHTHTLDSKTANPLFMWEIFVDPRAGRAIFIIP
jgi:hypothetical protein